MPSADYHAEIARRLRAEAATKTALLALQNDPAGPRLQPLTSGADSAVFTLRLQLLRARVAGGRLSLAAVGEALDQLLLSLPQTPR